MYNSEVIKILKNFSKKELKSFEGFLNRMYESKKLEVTFFNHIKDSHPKFQSPHLHKEKAALALYGSTSDKTKIDNISSKLKERIDEFLLWNESKKKSFDREFALMKIYRDRKLISSASRKEKRLKKVLQKPNNRGLFFHTKSLLLNDDLYFHSNTDKVKTKELIYKAKENLEKFYLLTKLKYTCEILFRNSILNETQPVEDLQEIEKIILSNHKDDKVIFMYWKIIQLLIKHKTKNYKEAKIFILKHYKLENLNEQAILFNFLLNYVISKLKEGNLFYAKELLPMYTSFFDIIIKQNGNISINTYLNAIYTASRLKEFEAAKHIIKTYQKFLPYIEQKDALNLAWAFFYFEKKEFNRVVESLEKIKTKKKQSFYIKFRTKALELMTAVEIKSDVEAFDKNCGSFRKYLSRQNKKIGKSNIRGGLNFIKLIKSLYLDEKDKSHLENKIIEMDFLIHKYWLLEKINEPYSS